MLTISERGEITLTRGDTAKISVTVETSAGEAYTLNEGDKLTLTVRKDTTAPEYVLQKEITEGNCFHITPADTAELEFGLYKYDVQLNTANGDVYTIITPKNFKIDAEVTY